MLYPISFIPFSFSHLSSLYHHTILTLPRRTNEPFYDSLVRLQSTIKSLRFHTNAMSIPTNSQKNQERGLALQKYLLLHSQHDALQKHLTQITTSMPPTPTASPSRSPDRFRYGSLSSSPNTDDGYLSSSPPSAIRNHRRSGSMQVPRPRLRTRRSSLPTVIDESILGEIAEEEMKLKSVNQQIKSTLTNLLNCESVRGNQRYRMWVQTRLMDAEKELKDCKSRSCERRRSEDIGGMMC
jgi:hypothetical protein